MSNVQTSFQVIIRLFIRAPLNLIVALTMSIFINPHVAVVFCVAAVLLGLVLGVIIKKAMPLFTDVFKRYDLLNNTVQENIVGIRVVKSFVREGFEENKFDRAIMYIYKLFVKAESTRFYNRHILDKCQDDHLREYDYGRTDQLVLICNQHFDGSAFNLYRICAGQHKHRQCQTGTRSYNLEKHPIKSGKSCYGNSFRLHIL